MNQYEYVVIGAGSVGCVVANHLTENPARSVLLLEADGEDVPSAIDTPGSGHHPGAAWLIGRTQPKPSPRTTSARSPAHGVKSSAAAVGSMRWCTSGAIATILTTGVR
jgi:choline dehydrogenase-like flavoprotein